MIVCPRTPPDELPASVDEPPVELVPPDELPPGVHGHQLLGLRGRLVLVVTGLVGVDDTRARLGEGHCRAGDRAHRSARRVDAEVTGLPDPPPDAVTL